MEDQLKSDVGATPNEVDSGKDNNHARYLRPAQLVDCRLNSIKDCEMLSIS